MGIEIKKFSGFLNTDDPAAEANYLHHLDSRNVTFRGDVPNMRVQNIPGTTLIPNQYLPAGTNECIGSFYDGLRQRIIWFNWNSNDQHGVYQYNIKTLAVDRIVASFIDSQIDILEFDRNFPIASINILYTTEEDGDILHWVARNNRPMKINIKDALNRIYGVDWIVDYLTVARPMPLIAPTCVYKNDATVNINNLRKKLYQFRYRWVYKDFTKSTWSPYSKLFAPAIPDDVATDIDEQKNNRIDVTIDSGNPDVVKVEIAARQTQSPSFSDNFLIKTIDKVVDLLPNNTLIVYQFFNDSSYPLIDLNEANLLFDYVPKISNTQELLNGNVIIYGGITEGYNFDETLDVDLTVEMIDYTTVDALTIEIFSMGSDPNPSCPSSDYQNFAFFRVIGTPTAGDIYTIVFTGLPISNTTSYTVQIGDGVPQVVTGLINAINALFATNSANNIAAPWLNFNEFYYQISVAPCTGGNPYPFSVSNIILDFINSNNPVDGVANSIYKHKSRYGYGLVYLDDFGVTNGVVTDNELLFETPELTATGGAASKIPKINVSINHQPPIWAKSYSFVRTANQTVQFLLSTVSCNTEKDSGLNPSYAYIEITNQQNNQNNFPVYEFTDGDRVRIIGVFVGALAPYDFPIVSLKTGPTINGAVVQGDFLVVPYDAVLSGFGSNDHYLIEIYTPALNSTSNQQFFYEFGETYEVLDAGTVGRRHAGQTQDQVIGSLPATFSFTRGDFYIKSRKIPLNADLSNVTAVSIIDQSVSDFFPSKVVGNGRAFVVDQDAGEVYFPTLLRWSLAYQQDTNINQTNRFYPANLDEVDRQRGDIQRFKSRDRILRIFQNRSCGQVGVYGRFIQNNQGNSELVTTDEIITSNNVQYYSGEYGLGDQYTGLVSGSIQDYFVDPVRGYQCRLSNDGITPISEIYKGQYTIRALLTPYNKPYIRSNGINSKVIGFYDFFEEQYHCILQEGTLGGSTIGNHNFSFNEKRNAYSCFSYDFIPEWIICAEDVTYSWKEGQLYIHNSSTTNNFYGIQYPSSIKCAFNQNLPEKKTWISLTEMANTIWHCPSIESSLISIAQLNLKQQSNLITQDFAQLEETYSASFLRDINSIGGIIEGDALKGNLLIINFELPVENSGQLSYLNEISVKYITSQLSP